MPIPQQQPGYHRVLLRSPSELPMEYEVGGYTDGRGVRRWTATYPDEEGDAYPSLAALDVPASRFSPGDAWQLALETWGGRNPYDFLMAPTLVGKRHTSDGDAGPVTTPFTVEKDDDGRMFVSGPCYRAGAADTDNEFMPQPTLKAFAHSLMIEGSRKADTDHDRQDRAGISLVESCMVKEVDGQFTIDPDGDTWWLKYEVIDPVARARVELPADDPRSLKSFSWEGLVRKRTAPVTKDAEARTPFGEMADDQREQAFKALTADKGDDEATELYDGRCIRVSLVHRGANSTQGIEGFAVATKSADADDLLGLPEQPPAQGGLLAALRRWAGKSDRATPFAGCPSLDEALALYRKGVDEALGDPDQVSSIVGQLSTALGKETSARAIKALAGTIAAEGSWFSPRSQETQMLTDEMKQEIAAQVKAELEKTQEPPADPAAPSTTDPKPEDKEPTREEIAAEAVKAAREALTTEHAEAIKAKDERIAELEADLDRAKKAPTSTPSGPNPEDQPQGGNKPEGDTWADLAQGAAKRRREITQKLNKAPLRG